MDGRLTSVWNPWHHEAAIARSRLIGSVVLVVIGIAFIALAPAKQSAERTTAVGA